MRAKLSSIVGSEGIISNAENQVVKPETYY